MASDAPQNYSNHVRHDKAAYLYLSMFLLSVILAVVSFFSSTHWLAAAVVVNSIASAMAAANARGYGTRVQDRIIRTEMKLRFRDLLQGDPHNRAGEFTIPQLVGLRFASDDELPALAQRVLDENVTKVNDIKKMVEDWRPDHLRV